MAKGVVPRSYVASQAADLLTELGVTASTGGGSPSELLEVLHRAAKDDSLGQHVRALLRIEAMLVAGRLSEAEPTLLRLAEEAEASNRIRGLALDRLGDLAWWRADFASAARWYERSLAARPYDRRTQKDLVRALWHLGNPDPARDSFGPSVDDSVDAPAGVVHGRSPSDSVIEVCGLYVGPRGAGVMVLQGCTDGAAQGMVATGSLGTMAQEACDLAWAIWRRTENVREGGVRLHAPQAAILKDGPSLGLAVYVLFGTAMGCLRPEATDAFTGELDLKGRVLAIGGASDKALAAYLTGLRRLFLPRANIEEVREGFGDILELHPVDHVNDLEGILR